MADREVTGWESVLDGVLEGAGIKTAPSGLGGVGENGGGGGGAFLRPRSTPGAEELSVWSLYFVLLQNRTKLDCSL